MTPLFVVCEPGGGGPPGTTDSGLVLSMLGGRLISNGSCFTATGLPRWGCGGGDSAIVRLLPGGGGGTPLLRPGGLVSTTGGVCGPFWLVGCGTCCGPGTAVFCVL